MKARRVQAGENAVAVFYTIGLEFLAISCHFPTNEWKEPKLPNNRGAAPCQYEEFT